MILEAFHDDEKRVENVTKESVPSSLIPLAGLMFDELLKNKEITSTQRKAFLVQVAVIKVMVNTDPLKQSALSKLRSLSAKEIEESTAFFQTATGRKFVEIEQEISSEWLIKSEELLTNTTNFSLPELGMMIEKLGAQSPEKLC